MNQVTRWFDHPLYRWMDEQAFSDMEGVLRANCRDSVIEAVLDGFENISLESIEYYPAGTYSEPEKTVLDNIPDFWLIRMRQRVAKKHTGTFRVYLPILWNGRFMGMAGAGTNNEVDWFSSVTFNVISWPMALKNGYACGVSDNDTGIRLDCTWGFDREGKLEWDHVEAWAYSTLHEMTVAAKKIVETVYEEDILASYMHGTSGGGREVITEAALFPEDYDGLWADGPAVNYLDLQFACLWAAVVEANEKHLVPISKYRKAREILLSDPQRCDLPFDSRQIIWMEYISGLLGVMTEDGPISREDLKVMVKTWDGPFSSDGKRMAYGFGPVIRQWPEGTDNPLYGYFKRKEDGRLVLMPIAEQSLRWFTGKPDLDVHSLSYKEFEYIYKNCRKAFSRYDFNDADFSALAKRGGRLMITHGTGDCIVPYQAAIDYYNLIMDHFPSEKIMNEAVRLYMPEMAGHSILNWTGPAVAISVGMAALTAWTEKGITPDSIPTVQYNFTEDRPVKEDSVEPFALWKYRRKIRRL